MRALLVVAVLALGARDAHAGACRTTYLGPLLLTRSGATIPSNGGVLIGFGPSDEPSKTDVGDDLDGLGGSDPSVPDGWIFRSKSRAVDTSVATIAPGLTVMTTVAKGKVTLRDGKDKKLGTYTVSKKKAKAWKVAAPTLKSVTVTQVKGRRSGTMTYATAALGAAAPDDAFALVLFRAGETSGMTWVQVDHGSSTSFGVYSSPGRCNHNPPDMSAPYDGASVEVAWVDRFGRVSAHSAAVTVTTK